MDTLVTVTLQRLGSDDAVRGLGELLGGRLAGVVRRGDPRSLLAGLGLDVAWERGGSPAWAA